MNGRRGPVSPSTAAVEGETPVAGWNRYLLSGAAVLSVVPTINVPFMPAW